jgi:hypothetical protein
MNFGCSICDYKSLSKENVKRHLNKKNSCGVGIKQIILIPTEIKCICNKFFSTERNLKKHQECCKYISKIKIEKKYENKSKFDQFIQNIDILICFITKYKRLPLLSKKNEQKLCRWMYNTNNKYENKIGCMKNEQFYGAWTNCINKYPTNYIQRTHLNFRNLEEFLMLKNKIPSANEKDLYNFIVDMRMRIKQTRGNLPDVFKDKWYNLLKDYNFLISKEEQWGFHLKKIENYIVEFNTLPTEYSEDKYEKFLGKWLGHQKIKFNNKKMHCDDEINKYRLEKFEGFLKSKIYCDITTKYKNQEKITKLIEKITKNEYERNIWPFFLKIDKDKRGLQLDAFNEKLKHAVEIQGKQHRQYISFFHNNERYRKLVELTDNEIYSQIHMVKKQQLFDEIKKRKCMKEGIILTIINDFDNSEEKIRIILQKDGLSII